ncbi:hypothetical protein JL721_1437 [Aureococcus anophagefferens]|nr:hypothetical protein JL721_1437 [Aureococcus anophagefferens]
MMAVAISSMHHRGMAKLLRCCLGISLLATPATSLAAFHSALSSVKPNDAGGALDEALTLLAFERGAEAPVPDLAFLCVGMPFESSLEALVDEAFERTHARVLVGVVGAGVIGGGREREMAECVSVAAGTLPAGTVVEPFVFESPGGGELPAEDYRQTERLVKREGTSCLLFGDPFSPVRDVAKLLDAWAPGALVVGGISCPASQRTASLALREVAAVTAQGAVGVGEPMTVTSSSAGNVVGALDGETPVDRLRTLLEALSKTDPRSAKLLQEALLVGVRATDEEDFLVRQVLGATTAGELLIGDPSIVAGETRLQFMVRDGVAAREDLESVFRRYALERQFSGGGARPLLSFLTSCAGRGEGLFEEPNVDTDALSELGAPVCGFFANGELGPVGARVASGGPTPTYLHGFTATAAVLCDGTPAE